MSSRPDCIFEIHQLWQSGFSRVYSNCCCSCSFECEIIKIGQSSNKMHRNNIPKFKESTILHACKKKSGNLLNAPRIFIYMHLLYIYSKVRTLVLGSSFDVSKFPFQLHFYVHVRINTLGKAKNLLIYLSVTLQHQKRRL